MIRDALRAGLLGHQREHVLTSGVALDRTVHIYRTIMDVNAQTSDVQR